MSKRLPREVEELQVGDKAIYCRPYGGRNELVTVTKRSKTKIHLSNAIAVRAADGYEWGKERYEYATGYAFLPTVRSEKTGWQIKPIDPEEWLQEQERREEQRRYRVRLERQIEHAAKDLKRYPVEALEAIAEALGILERDDE